MQTRLLYLQDMCTLSCQAHVVSVIQDAGECRLVLDQTVFYPQCGGTHVINTKDIGYITIRKIKNEKGNLRVSYAVI